MSVARQKGTTYENWCADYLGSHGLPVTREEFSSPLGDLRGIPVTIECKARKAWEPSDWLAQVQRADARTGHGMYCVLAKKRQANVKDGYFLTTLEKGTILLRAYVWALAEGFTP